VEVLSYSGGAKTHVDNTVSEVTGIVERSVAKILKA
jgi:hypothetical protein